MAGKSFFSFLFGVILVFFALNNISAQYTRVSESHNRNVFEYHFDRADRELNPESWLREARRGLEYGAAAWERTVWELYADPVLAMEAMQEMTRWSEEELQKRYAQWLFNRFFGVEAGRAAYAMDKAVEKANGLYAFHTDSDGNVLYDDAGDPDSVRPYEGRSIEEDLMLWNQLIARVEEAELKDYQLSLGSVFPELSYITNIETGNINKWLTETVNRSIISRQAEFEALLAREERLFVARRTGDLYSLRKESENESAAAISSRLIREAQNYCTAGITALEERIEAAKAEPGNHATAGEEWLAVFQEQFEKGLKAWNEAEERFIVRRMEWERDSGDRFREGQEAWQTAFSEFETERLAWENKAGELFKAGEALFVDASEKLNTAIAGAKETFQKDAALRISGAKDRAHAVLDMYLTCESVLAEARSNVDFWLSRFVSGAPEGALENGTISAWVQEIFEENKQKEIIRALLVIPKLKEKIVLLTEHQKNAGKELLRWTDLYSQYQVKAKESFASLEKEFSLALGMNGKSLTAVLDSSSEDFFLDEYQIELLRAKAIADYWEQRLSIAEAVSAYAEDVSAGRMTEAESLREWRAAKDRYDESLAVYEVIQKKLTNEGHVLASIKEEVRTAAAVLHAEEQKLEELNNRYSLQLAAYQSSSGNYIRDELNSCYEILTELIEKRESDEDYYTAYSNAEQKYYEEYTLAEGWVLLKAIAQSEKSDEEKKAQLTLLLEEYDPERQAESVKNAWYSLGEVFAEFGIEGNNAILDGELLVQQLLVYSKEQNVSPAFACASLLIQIDEKIGLQSAMLNEKIKAWHESFVNCMALQIFHDGVTVTDETEVSLAKYEAYLELALELYDKGENYEAIAKEASFYRYLVNFFAAYNNCAAMPVENNEKQHWRSYVSDLTGTEGQLLDAYDKLGEASRVIKETFTSFMARDVSIRQSEFLNTVSEYFDDPRKTWEDKAEDLEFNMAEELFWEESEKLKNNLEYEESLKQDIASLGFEYSQLLPSGQAAFNELQRIAKELETVKVSHQDAFRIYNQKASQFSERGSRYEELYGESKKLFTAVEDARIAYEKQDAIQRWAATSYLNNSSKLPEDIHFYLEPAEELAYSKEQSNRAQIALSALEDLYKNNETTRPYANEAYARLYKEYQKSYSRMFLALKARTEFMENLKEEEAKNQELYFYSAAFASSFLSPEMADYYSEYEPPSLHDSSWLDFIKITDSGDLSISRDKNFVLSRINRDDASNLSRYFQNKAFSGDGSSQMSAFEKAMASWANRLAEYNLGDNNNYQNWGLAFDYFVRAMVENNPELNTLAKSYTLTDMGSDGMIELDGDSLDSRLNSYRSGKLKEIQAKAWNNLTVQQKKDLEFLAVLYLTGGGGEGASGFDRISQYNEMSWLYGKADHYVMKLNMLFFSVTVYRWPYTFDHSELSQVIHASRNRRDNFEANIDQERAKFSSEISKLSGKAKEYEESCKRLSLMLIQREQGVSWQDIEVVISGFSDGEKERLREYWKELLDYRGYNNKNPYTTIGAALNDLYTWSTGVRNTTEQKLEEAYANHQDERQIHQNSFRQIFDDFVNGETSLDKLNNAAELAYGYEAASQKKHLHNLGTTMLSDLKKVNANRAAYTNQYRELASQYADLIESAYSARFLSELSAREVSWNEQRKDLYNKRSSWNEASALIIERGRQAWKDGLELMRASYSRWEQDFSEQYAAVDAAWNLAYLESINNKEHWIDRVLTAASESLDADLLKMLGTDAESFGRNLDTFMPSHTSGMNTAEEAQVLLQQVLNSAGISKMSDAFGSFAGSAKTVSTITEQGISGLGLWNSAQVQAAAGDFVRTGTNVLADGKMTLLAFKARESIYDAKKSLNETIAQGNKNIDDRIDELYTFDGGWLRSGDNYVKEIIVHSTLFRSAITDRVVLDAYRFFVLDHWELLTDLSDENFENMNHIAIQGIIGRAEAEIKEKSLHVFGNGDSGGEFNAWVGAAPIDGNDKGSGELGRLVYDFNIWENKQAQGISAMSAPFWDKPLWDSRGSWFSAPSLRSAVDTMNSIAAAVVGAVLTPFSAGGSLALSYGISMTDDLFFNALDVANGYKDWGEFGFAVGKTALINAATTAGKVVFNGLGQTLAGSTKFSGLTAKVIDNASKVGQKGVIASKTFMSGVEAISTSTVTSAVSAISYNNGKLGWNWNSFKSGMKGGLVNAVVAGTNIITTETMNLGLEGFYGKHYYDGTRLSSFAGGLAGQGMNYALGGDFTLNALNLGSFNQHMAGYGLVELHFGRDGFGGNFGTGGIDVSLRTLAGASRGLEAWKVNFDILASGSESARNYASQMRTLYSSGDTGRNLYDSILANETMVIEDQNVEYTRTTYDPVIGKMIVLGNDAINDKSRFGLNVVFSHEAYRNGMDDGAAGQRQETDMAVMGHISAALGLKQTYGWGVLGEEMANEAKKFDDSYNKLISGTASDQEKMEALANLGAVLGGYDSNDDYWRMQHNGTLVSDGSGWLRDESGYYINDDGTRTYTRTEQTIGAEYAKTGLLNIMFGGNKFSKEQITVAENILKAAGLAVNGTGLKGVKLGMDFVMYHAGDTVSNEVFKAYYNNTMDYNIANVYKVDLIFNKKGNWHPNKVYSNSSKRYTQLLREKYDAYSRNELIDLLKDKYLQTMVTDEGKYVNMLKISADNPYISMLQNQNSIAFSNPNSPYYNYSLWQWGCNFMTTIAIPQLLTGNVLSAREVTDVWNWAISTGNPLNNKEPYNHVVTGPGDLAGYVNNVDMLANHVLQDVFGYQDHTLTFNFGSLQRPRKAGATNFVAVREQYDPTHFFLDNTRLEKIYDPWPYINRLHNRYDGVFLDIRRMSGNGYH